MDELTVLTWRVPRDDAAVLERAAVPESGRAQVLAQLRDASGAKELVYVQTCQRVAFALLHGAPDAGERVQRAYAALLAREVPAPESFNGRDAFRHLGEVASSLDSLVVGEPQVLGQLKEGVQRSEDAGLSHGGMRHVFSLVFRAAKAVRSETELFRGKVSLVPLTEDLIESHLRGKAAPRVVVLGTGQIGQRMVEMLRAKHPDAALHLVSRDGERARTLAASLGPHASGASLEEFLASEPHAADVLALAMASERPLLDAKRLEAHATSRDTLVLDLALPRNAEAPAAPVQGLTLVQLDDLARMSHARKAERAQEIAPARRVLDRELARIDAQYAERKLNHDLARLNERFDEISQARWEGAPAGIDLSDAAVRKWYEQTVRALLHEAAAAVKKAGCERREP